MTSKRTLVRGGETVSRQAHNLEIAGSTPAPVTTLARVLLARLPHCPECWEERPSLLSITVPWSSTPRRVCAECYTAERLRETSELLGAMAMEADEREQREHASGCRFCFGNRGIQYLGGIRAACMRRNGLLPVAVGQ